METSLTTAHLIDQYKLQPHPEGGYYASTYQSTELIPVDALPYRFKGSRFHSTAIYFLLTHPQFSAFHRIKSDELWHFYAGVGLEIFVIHPDGRGEVLLLGNQTEKGFSFQQLVPAECWFASRPVTNGFAFVGCTVAPGFDFEDFELADRASLLEEYPQHKEWIVALTNQA